MSHVGPIIEADYPRVLPEGVVETFGGAALLDLNGAALLDLNFAAGNFGALESNSASAVMAWDADGALAWSPHNLLSDTDAQESDWGVIRGTKGSTGNALGYAYQDFNEDGTAANTHLMKGVFAAVSGQTYEASFLVEPLDRDFVYFTTNATSTSRTFFNLATGTIGTLGGSHIAATITEEYPGVYRCQVTFKVVWTGNKSFVIGAADADNSYSYSGASVPAYRFYTAKAEKGEKFTGWIETNGSAWFGPIEMHDPDGTNPRLFGAPAFTNLVTDSLDLSAAAFTKQNGLTVTTDSIAGPDGMINMDRITSDGTTGGRVVYTGWSGHGNGNVTFSAIFKDGTVGSGTSSLSYASDYTVALVRSRNIDLGDGFTLRTATWTLSAGGTFFQPILYTNSDDYGAIAAGGYAYCGYCQLTATEDFVGVYLPTYGAAAAYTISTPRVRLPQTEVKTYLLEGVKTEMISTAYRPVLNFELSGERLSIYRQSFTKLTIRIDSGGVQEFEDVYYGVDFAEEVAHSIAVRVSENDFAVYIDGSQAGTDGTFNPPVWNDVKGALADIFQMGGNTSGLSMKRIRMFADAKDNAALAALSA